MSGKAKDILQLDLYGLLGIENTATAKEIKKAYRQKALTCHPDKNPDNPDAAALFHQLSQALEVLTDAAAKASYDKVIAAKKQAEERNRKLDEHRKKIKLDLEAREQLAAQQEGAEQNTRRFEDEIKRIREEGSRLLAEQQRLVREQIERDRETLQADMGVQRCSKGGMTPVLKLKWKCKKDDQTNGGYSQEVLLGLLQKYGDVLSVIISRKKMGSALVEFATVRAAERAVRNERGLSGNHLKISWVEQPKVMTPTPQPGQFTTPQASLTNERDYETLVMMKMRQVAERQRLIEQMQKEDEEDEATSRTQGGTSK